MSGLKYHGGMKGLYAMLALTEAKLAQWLKDEGCPSYFA